jgi:hypothetical protein
MDQNFIGDIFCLKSPKKKVQQHSLSRNKLEGQLSSIRRIWPRAMIDGVLWTPLRNFRCLWLLGGPLVLPSFCRVAKIVCPDSTDYAMNVRILKNSMIPRSAQIFHSPLQLLKLFCIVSVVLRKSSVYSKKIVLNKEFQHVLSVTVAGTRPLNTGYEWDHEGSI